jgi:Flp pilus assembly protein TadG
MHVPRTARRWAGRAVLAALVVTSAPAVTAAPIEILFVGNSYTFGRVDPVMSYNAANVHDLTAGFYAASSTGANPWEPHPWGGIAGIFKQFTVQKGLDYDVSISARNAASLRGQFLNTANAAWDLRGNIASQKWDVVVLQEQSDAALPVGMGKNANPAQFAAYANKLEQFIHNGAAQSYTETQLYGSLAACQATGSSTTTCNTVRNIPKNANASADTKVYLTETWARPDMVYAHLTTTADTTSPTGSPIPDGTNTQATLYYQSLAAMTDDLRTTIYGEAAANGHFAGVIGAGDAFQLAFDQGLVRTSGFYDASGVFVPNTDGVMNLWWDDYLHASKYGSYLDALVQFGTITGFDPRSLGANEIAARDLGISAANALILQQVAAQQLGMVPEPASVAMMMLGLGLIGAMRVKRNAGRVGVGARR